MSFGISSTPGGLYSTRALPERLDADAFQEMILEYRFPLRAQSEWCPHSEAAGSAEGQGATPYPCQFAGMRVVDAQLSQDTPTGHYADCFQLSDRYNGGGVQQTFCDGAGLVERRYDHAGTRFGFLWTLQSFQP